MFFMLARNRTSNASPTTGIAPMVVSRKAFASIRAISQLGAPSCRGFPDQIGRHQTRDYVACYRDQADDAIETEARWLVPGTTNAPSIRRASASRRASDCCLPTSKGMVLPLHVVRPPGERTWE